MADSNSPDDVAIITLIGTVNPDALRENLRERDSRFFRNTGLAYDDPLVRKLRLLTEGGEDLGPEMRLMHSAEKVGITVDDLRQLGQGVYNLYLRFGTKNKNGEPLYIDANEFMGWQGTAGAGKPNYADRSVTADVWAQNHHVALKLQPAEEIDAQGQHVVIETPLGMSRSAGGGLISEPFKMHYGSIRIFDAQSGEPIIMGKDGELDLYAPERAIQQLREGKPYLGTVVIKSYLEDNNADPKVFFTSDAREAIMGEDAGLPGPRKLFNHVAGASYDMPVEITQTYADMLVKEKANFFTMSGSQFQAWQYALSEDESLRVQRPEKWIERAFGSKERFDAAFKDIPDGQVLSREQYHQILEKEQQLQDIRSKMDEHGVSKAHVAIGNAAMPLAQFAAAASLEVRAV